MTPLHERRTRRVAAKVRTRAAMGALVVLGTLLEARQASAADPAEAGEIATSSDAARAPQATNPHLTIDVGGVGAVQQLRLARGNLRSQSADFMALGFADNGGGISLGVGAAPVRAGAWGAMVRASYIYGRPLDLGTHEVAVGGEGIAAITKALHVVGGGHIAWLAIQRATNDGLIQHWGIGASLGVELAPLTGAFSPFVRPEITASLIPHALVNPWGLVWGGTLTAGIRFAAL